MANEAVIIGAGIHPFGRFNDKSAELLAKEAVDMVTHNNFLMPPNMLPQHPFSGPLIYLPVPLLSLVIGGALALSSGKKPAND